jgi:hypothetical protein
MLYLIDIATIRSGYLFRERIKPDASGQYLVIQAGDILPDAGFSGSSLVRVSLPDVKRSQVLEKAMSCLSRAGLVNRRSPSHCRSKTP